MSGFNAQDKKFILKCQESGLRRGLLSDSLYGGLKRSIKTLGRRGRQVGSFKEDGA